MWFVLRGYSLQVKQQIGYLQFIMRVQMPNGLQIFMWNFLQELPLIPVQILLEVLILLLTMEPLVMTQLFIGLMPTEDGVIFLADKQLLQLLMLLLIQILLGIFHLHTRLMAMNMALTLIL